MLLTKTVMVKWSSNNKKWYENKGYVYSKIGEEFEVKIEDLTKGSNVLVDVKCDSCGEILKNVRWSAYNRYVHEDGKYYCKKCARELFGRKSFRLKWLKNGKSFYQWCYDNLPKELADYILSRWDENLNIDENGNILTPKDVSYGSLGFNRKGYWFNCLDHPEHGSELKSINSFTSGKKGSITCKQCNSISNTHPHLIKYFVNKEDIKKYSAGVVVKTLMICPDCGNEKEMYINSLSAQGFSCNRCGDGVPYPEKFLSNLLGQLNIIFKTQLTKTTFKWCEKYKYDNYIDNINCIIETHGLQHYKETTGRHWGKLSITQENDKNKEQLAKENGIENYIVLDCRHSELEWIKNSIMTSKLPQLLNFKEKDINWLNVHEASCTSMIKIVSNLWTEGIKSTSKMANILKIHSATVGKYLKKGTELGWCDYDAEEEIKKNYISMHKKNRKKVICINNWRDF